MRGEGTDIRLDGLDARQEVGVGHDAGPSLDILHILARLRRNWCVGSVAIGRAGGLRVGSLSNCRRQLVFP